MSLALGRLDGNGSMVRGECKPIAIKPAPRASDTVAVAIAARKHPPCAKPPRNSRCVSMLAHATVATSDAVSPTPSTA
jgi:hypothetical protein